ncbi:MAG: TonB-dependent receptor, partial [Bacteroidota bacterium]
MKSSFTFLLVLMGLIGQAQISTTSIKGQLQDPEGTAIAYANVVLYSSADSSMVKVETSNDAGLFNFASIAAGSYFLKATYVGFADLSKKDIQATGNTIDLGILSFQAADLQLAEVTVKASRAMVEVKPDRTVFNVEGTINSVGEDAIALLRKAPGVTVDNNNNINVLGRTGVLIYVDGRRLPLGGEDLTNYLQNLQAAQIDRIDIITNPGARYEAQGNAGIIDIRLKRDKGHGTNGSVGGTISQGRHTRYNLNTSANFRNKRLNAFGTMGYANNDLYDEMRFQGTQNGLFMDETNDMRNMNQNYNLRLGTDFFINKQNTLGILASLGKNNRDNTSDNRISLATIAAPDVIDSILVSDNSAFGG